ncbi:GGDEF domain-containing protein [uncultured Cohaesibacter sp.]|uniref:GGDEF domain-containing protein n=1 Tax=uncultured Cohaesibacter sp. TaxID=1002546 RepID=UPI002930D4E5|nr:GGDEF domain-containing protein [uncultured Cohaesibacter sp.]
MSNTLDLATVLLLQKSTYIVGIFAFVYLWYTTNRPTSLVLLATGFLLMAVGSTLAGLGEWQAIPDIVWMLGSLLLGMFGYSFIWFGVKSLSSGMLRRSDFLVLALPVGITFVAMATRFDEVNAYRATVFNAAAALSFFACAVRIYHDGSKEPVRARTVLTVICLTSALLSAGNAIAFIEPALMVIHPIDSFFYTIMLNFALVLFIAALLGERSHGLLRKQANTDPLTGISNRRSFFMNFIAQPKDGDVVLLLDLDHFKKINDRFGHIAGDVVLQTIARRIEGCIRSEDVLARYGGEEFIILLPRAGRVQAEIISERIRHAVCANPVICGDASISVTVSIGVALAEGESGSLQALINTADSNLYQAKDLGRNRVEPNSFKQVA